MKRINYREVVRTLTVVVMAITALASHFDPALVATGAATYCAIANGGYHDTP